MAHVISDECISCGACIPECPVDAISVGDIYVVDPTLCNDCGACVEVCPTEAISRDMEKEKSKLNDEQKFIVVQVPEDGPVRVTDVINSGWLDNLLKISKIYAVLKNGWDRAKGRSSNVGLCRTCGGTGEVIIFCKSCNGTGIYTGYCYSCNGSGTHLTRSGKDEVCTKCEGTGLFKKTCLKCDGDGKLRFRCKKCLGTGIYTGKTRSLF